METPIEVGVYTDLNPDNSCLKVFDIGSNTELRAYRDGNAGPHCVAFEHRDYFISGLHGKQLIHFWDKWKEQVSKKIVCPGKINALALSPDGNYCVVGLAEKIYIWQIPTGNLVSVLTKHYQPISCLKFLDTGSHFLSGAEDGLVISWNFAKTMSSAAEVSTKTNSQVTLHTWSHHSLPVTDIYVGSGGIRCRIVTASLDQTCKLYDFASGFLICSFVFDGGITSVVMDTTEYRLFAGGVLGSIGIINLFKSGLKKEHYVEKEDSSGKMVLSGHNKQVTSLAVTMDGCTLLSGSMDSTCRLWHIESRQCIRTIQAKGPVTNATIIRTPYQLYKQAPQNRLLQPIGNFKRVLFTPSLTTDTGHEDTAGGKESCLPVVLREIKEDEIFSCWNPDSREMKDTEDRSLLSDVIQKYGKPYDSSSESRSMLTRAELEDKLETLENSNQKLRQFISNRLVERIAMEENEYQETL